MENIVETKMNVPTWRKIRFVMLIQAVTADLKIFDFARGAARRLDFQRAVDFDRRGAENDPSARSLTAIFLLKTLSNQKKLETKKIPFLVENLKKESKIQKSKKNFFDHLPLKMNKKYIF